MLERVVLCVAGVPETAEIAYEMKTMRPVSLSILLMVYLFL